MARKVYDVLPDGENGTIEWKVKLEGAHRAAAKFENKNEAVDAGRELAQKTGLGQLRIYGKNGEIQKEYTCGKDPEKYKG